jgi:hypothetical protein
MADATAAMLAPPLVAEIERTGSLANLRVLPLTTRDPRRLVDAGEAELAVGFFPEAVTVIVAQGPDSVLRHARVYTTRYVCAWACSAAWCSPSTSSSPPAASWRNPTC